MIHFSRRFFVFFLFLSAGAKAQLSNVDSILQLIPAAKSDTEKVNHYLNACDAVLNADLEKCREYAGEAMKLALNSDYPKGVSRAKTMVGIYHKYKGNFDSALYYYHASEKILLDEKDPRLEVNLSRVYTLMGLVYSDKGNHTTSLEYHLKSLKLAEKNNNEATAANVLNNIGHTYYLQKDFKQALAYHFRCVEIRKKLHNDQALSWS